MSTLNFHVRHEVTPERVWEVLDAVARRLDYHHVTQFDRQISRLRQLELITSKGPVQLTDNGRELHRIGTRRIELVPELMHFLQYTRWRPSAPTVDTMFFTYCEYCKLLFEGKVIDLDSQRAALAAEMSHRITYAIEFTSETLQLAKGAVALSNGSLIGVEHWLAKLSPEVVINDRFELRHYCPPESLLMALGYVTEITEAQIGVEQPLTDERRKTLCGLCMIDDTVLNQMLEWLYPVYPDHIQPGTSTGRYGQFIVLLKQPNLRDLLI